MVHWAPKLDMYLVDRHWLERAPKTSLLGACVLIVCFSSSTRKLAEGRPGVWNRRGQQKAAANGCGLKQTTREERNHGTKGTKNEGNKGTRVGCFELCSGVSKAAMSYKRLRRDACCCCVVVRVCVMRGALWYCEELRGAARCCASRQGA